MPAGQTSGYFQQKNRVASERQATVGDHFHYFAIASICVYMRGHEHIQIHALFKERMYTLTRAKKPNIDITFPASPNQPARIPIQHEQALLRHVLPLINLQLSTF